MAHSAHVGTTVPFYAFIGHSGSGKTTLIERVIAELCAHGLRVVAIKHDPKGHAAYDQPGKDSHRLREAGALETILSGPTMVARFTPVQADTSPLALAEQLDAESDVDLILAEGYHMYRGFPKIEVYRSALGRPPRGADSASRGDVIAVATDTPGDPLLAEVYDVRRVGILPLDDAAAIAEFLMLCAVAAPADRPALRVAA